MINITLAMKDLVMEVVGESFPLKQKILANVHAVNSLDIF